MKAERSAILIMASLVISAVAITIYAPENPVAPSHGIAYPEGWQKWAIIAVSHRTDNNTLRVL